MIEENRQTPVRVLIMALPETTPTALYGMYEVFSSVGVIWPALTGDGEIRPRLDVAIVSEDGKPFTGALGIPITPACSFANSGTADVVLVTDLEFTSEFDPRGRWPAATQWLVEQHDGGATVCSVCTGAILLADSGLLDNREATTHWGACDLLQAYYPNIELKPERIVVPVGEEHRIITSGGTSSWEDLALYLIARFCGRAEAVKAAKIYLFGDRSEGQLPYAAMGRRRQHDDAVIADCQTWVAMHYCEHNPVSQMAAQSGLAERTFKRRFRQATGYSPMDYVQTLRIEEAKQVLETSDMATDSVARLIGYEDPTYFRRLFKKRTGVTPARYRQRFRAVAHI